MLFICAIRDWLVAIVNTHYEISKVLAEVILLILLPHKKHKYTAALLDCIVGRCDVWNVSYTFYFCRRRFKVRNDIPRMKGKKESPLIFNIERRGNFTFCTKVTLIIAFSFQYFGKKQQKCLGTTFTWTKRIQSNTIENVQMKLDRINISDSTICWSYVMKTSTWTLCLMLISGSNMPGSLLTLNPISLLRDKYILQPAD